MYLLHATSLAGVHITKALASASGNFRRLAILTSAKTASTKTELLAELRFQGVEVIVGDLANDAFLKETFQGAGVPGVPLLESPAYLADGQSDETYIHSAGNLDLANCHTCGTLYYFFADFEIIVSALGRNALHLQPHVVDIVAALPKLPNGHVRRFYPSEYGTDIRYDDKTSPHGKSFRKEKKMENSVLAYWNRTL